MKKLALQIAVAVAPAIAVAGGDSGTSSMSEMQISGAQLGMMVGALVALGVVIWLVAKFTMGGSSAKK